VPKVCLKDKGAKSKSPLYYAHKITAPTLLIHGDQDTRVPIRQSMMMIEAMKKYGKNVKLKIVKGGTHSPDSGSPEWQAAWKLMIDFFDTNLSNNIVNR
jgi:dipeptidyl aminopeptidase/acylaminoacyl peptidase